MERILKDQNGMTLVTVMMAMALSALVGLALMNQQVANYKSVKMNESRTEVTGVRRSLMLLMDSRESCDLAFRDGANRPPEFVQGVDSNTRVNSVQYSNNTQVLVQGAPVGDYTVESIGIRVLDEDIETGMADFNLSNGVTLSNGRRHLGRLNVNLIRKKNAIGAPELSVPIDIEITTGIVGNLPVERIATCRTASGQVVAGGGGGDNYQRICSHFEGSSWDQQTQTCKVNADSGGWGQVTVEVFCTWSFINNQGNTSCNPPMCPSEFPQVISEGCNLTGAYGASLGHAGQGVCRRLCYRSISSTP